MLSGLFPKSLRRGKPRYTSLNNESGSFADKEPFLADAEYSDMQSNSDGDSGDRLQTVYHPRPSNSLIWMNVVLFILSTIMFTSSFLLRGPSPEAEKQRNYFLKQTSEPCMIPRFGRVWPY